MAHTVSVIAGAQDRTSRTAFLGDRNRPLKHMRRANIALLSTERLPVLEVVRRASVSRPAVRRWQVRYAEQGVDGLLRDKTRKPGRARLPAATVARVLALTCSEPPGAVLSIDEKSQIQTLDRTQPGLPLKPGRCGTITHDYKPNGTTALFAALNTFDGTMVGRCMPRHTHKQGVRHLPQGRRAGGPGRQGHPCHRRQLRDPKHPKVLELNRPGFAGGWWA